MSLLSFGFIPIKKKYLLISEIFLPHILSFSSLLYYRIALSCPILRPGKRSHASDNSQERSHQRVSLTSIISGHRDIAIYRVWRFAPILLACNLRVWTNVRACTYTRVEHEFLRLSLREKKRSHGKIYRVGGERPPDPRAGYRDPPVYIRVRTRTRHAWMTENPITSRRAKTILIAVVGDVRSHEGGTEEHPRAAAIHANRFLRFRGKNFSPNEARYLLLDPITSESHRFLQLPDRSYMYRARFAGCSKFFAYLITHFFWTFN